MQDEEAKNKELAIQKVRQAHTNISKILLKVREALAQPAINPTIGTIQTMVRNEEPQLKNIYSQYEQLSVSGRIENVHEPITTQYIRKKLIEDISWPWQSKQILKIT